MPRPAPKTRRPVAPRQKPALLNPPGFSAFLLAYNQALDLPRGGGYSATSSNGQRIARRYAEVLAGGKWTLRDMLEAIVEAKRRVPRWKSALHCNVFWANLEELIIEPRMRPGAPPAAPQTFDADGLPLPAADDEEARLRALARSLDGRPDVFRHGEELVEHLRGLTPAVINKREMDAAVARGVIPANAEPDWPERWARGEKGWWDDDPVART